MLRLNVLIGKKFFEGSLRGTFFEKSSPQSVLILFVQENHQQAHLEAF